MDFLANLDLESNIYMHIFCIKIYFKFLKYIPLSVHDMYFGLNVSFAHTKCSEKCQIDRLFPIFFAKVYVLGIDLNTTN